jgi:hypothetical protein
MIIIFAPHLSLCGEIRMNTSQGKVENPAEAKVRGEYEKRNV